MVKVLVFGTFDGLHEGHINFLNQARKHGNHLIAVIARDKTVKRVKKSLPVFKERQRLKIVQNSNLADKVILGSLGNPFAVIKKIKPNVICLGYDQKFFIKDLPQEIKRIGLKIKIVRLKPFKPEIYHTSKLRKNQVY